MKGQPPLLGGFDEERGRAEVPVCLRQSSTTQFDACRSLEIRKSKLQPENSRVEDGIPRLDTPAWKMESPNPKIGHGKLGCCFQSRNPLSVGAVGGAVPHGGRERRNRTMGNETGMSFILCGMGFAVPPPIPDSGRQHDVDSRKRNEKANPTKPIEAKIFGINEISDLEAKQTH